MIRVRARTSITIQKHTHTNINTLQWQKSAYVRLLHTALCPWTVFWGLESHQHTSTPFTLKPHRADETRWLYDSFCTVIPIIATTKTTPSPYYYHRTDHSIQRWHTRGSAPKQLRNMRMAFYILLNTYMVSIFIRNIYAYGNLINNFILQKGKTHLIIILLLPEYFNRQMLLFVFNSDVDVIYFLWLQQFGYFG